MDKKTTEDNKKLRQNENGENKNKMSLKEAKKKAYMAKLKVRIVCIIAIIVALFVVGKVVFDKLFIVSEFEIRGENQYTPEYAESIAKKIGLQKGIHIFSFDKSEYEQKAKYYIPEFDDVKIEYGLPDTLVFKVKEAKPEMYVELNGQNYVLSSELKVLEMTENATEIEGKVLKKINIGKILKCQTGAFIETESGNEAILKELIEILKEEKIYPDVSEIDVNDKFDLTFAYDGRFTILLGNSENLTVKVRFMKSIVKSLEGTSSGYIDVTDENFREGIFYPYD